MHFDRIISTRSLALAGFVLATALAIMSIFSTLVPLLVALAILTIGIASLLIVRPIPVTIVFIAILPFHSLAMRFIEVHIGLPSSVLLAISVWKEIVLVVLLISLTRQWKVQFYLTDVLILVYVLYNFLFVLRSESPVVGFYGLRGIVEPFAFYYLGRKLPMTSARLSKLIGILALVGVIVSIFGFVQATFLGRDFLMKYRAVDGILSNSHMAALGARRVIRASSTFTSPNHLGMYLAILMVISLGVLNQAKKVNFKIIIVTLILLGGLLLTFSRSSWLALFVGVLVLFSLRLRIRKRLFIFFAILGIVALPVGLSLDVFQRISETLTLEDPSAAGKIPSILNGIELVIENPLGIGLGMSGPRSTRFMEVLTYHSESYYVLMAIEIGVIGLGLYLSLLLGVVVDLYRINRIVTAPEYKGLTLGVIAAVIGVSAGVMFLPSLQELVIAGLLWFFIGLSMKLSPSNQEYSTNTFQKTSLDELNGSQTP